MLRGDLRGGATCYLASNATCFQEYNRKASLTKQIGGTNAYNPRANHRHVCGVRAYQSRVRSLGSQRCPATIRLAGKLGSQDAVRTDRCLIGTRSTSGHLKLPCWQCPDYQRSDALFVPSIRANGRPGSTIIQRLDAFSRPSSAATGRARRHAGCLSNRRHPSGHLHACISHGRPPYPPPRGRGGQRSRLGNRVSPSGTHSPVAPSNASLPGRRFRRTA
jgi:hypothetical protein